MVHYNDLAEVITSNRDKEEQGILFVSKENMDNYISYSQIYKKALIRLGNLQKIGFKKYDKLIFQIGNNEEFVLLFWACILGGIVPIPLIEATNKEQRVKLINVFEITDRATVVFSKEKQQAIIRDLKKDNESAVAEEIENRSLLIEDVSEGMILGKPQDINENDMAFIQFSSGSTGTPKGVTLTHKNLICNIKDIVTGIDVVESDSTLSWLPLTHDMGIIGFHLAPFYAGINQTIIDSSLFIYKPMMWMDLTHKEKATILSSPNFGYKYFLKHFAEGENKWDLSNVRLIFNGAEPIDVDLAEEFLHTMREFNLSKTSMFTVYGMAEACLAVSFPKPDTEIKHIKVNRRKLTIGKPIEIVESNGKYEVKLCSNGYPLGQCKVRIVDEFGHVLPEGYIGNIEIKGDNVTSGYYNNAVVTEELINEDGWLSTGDLGTLYEGCVYITGRKKDLIIINGVNYYSTDIERVCSEVDGVESNKVIACSVANKETMEENLGIFVNCKGDDDKLIKLINDLKRVVLDKSGIEPQYVIPIKRIHKTTSGKVRRYKYVEEFNEGIYDEIIEKFNKIKATCDVDPLNVDYDAVSQNFINIIKEELGVAEISMQQQLMSFGADSIKITRIHSRLEELYPNRVNISDFYAYPTINDLIEHIKNNELIEINANKFPKDKLTDKGEEYSIDLLLEDKVYCRLEEISRAEDVEIKDIILSVLIYLFNCIGENDNCISVQIIKSSDTLEELYIDLSKYDNMSDLYKAINGLSKSDTKKYNKSNIKYNNQLKGVYLAFNYNNDFINNFIDLLLEVDSTRLKFSFSKVFKKDVAIDFVEKYNRILGQL
jgi:acyl-CoA synthetase (AMP-forming)/AMP-acid ligase II/acyl carrier protein